MKKILMSLFMLAIFIVPVSFLAGCGETKTTYTVDVTTDKEMGTVSGMGLYKDGETVTLKAIANDGFKFVEWKENDIMVSTESIYTFVVSKNISLYAQFESTNVQNSYNIEVVGGIGSGTYQEGEMVTISSEDSVFLWWQIEGQDAILSTEKSYNFVASKDMKIVSHGIDREMGFAILESAEDWNLQNSYNFMVNEANEAFVNGKKVSAVYKGINDVWRNTDDDFNLVGLHSLTKYEIKDLSNQYAYVFWLYKDFDGSVKANLLYPKFQLKAGLEFGVPGTPSNTTIKFEDVK